MKTVKRLASLLLVLALVIGAVGFSVVGESWAASGNFEEDLLLAYQNGDTTFDMSAYNMTTDQAKTAFYDFWEKNSGLFYIEKTYSFSYNPTTKIVTKATLKYSDSLTLTRETARVYAAAVKEATDKVKSGMGDMEKALVLHDHLALVCEYDYDNYRANTIPDESRTAFGALVEGKAVCQGYAAAYQDLCHRVGLECVTVDSTPMNHAWNLVKIDGVWYHVDVTWDDPAPDTIGMVHHENFLRSDAGIATTGNDMKHNSWTSKYTCSDTRYDDYPLWKGVNTQIVYTGTGKYYKPEVSGRGNKTQTLSIKTETGKTLASFSTKWDVFGKSNYYWTDNYSAMAYANGLLFVNDASKIYSVNPTSGKTETVFTYSGKEGSIYGIALKDGKMAYLVAEEPAKGGKIYYIDIPAGTSGTSPVDPIPVPTVDLPADAENPFTDVLKGTYFYDAALWAYYNGITTGTSADKFSPAGTCDRGQTLTFLWRASGSPEPTSNTNPFYDVKASDYYYKAVLWGVEKGITTGTSSNTFSPKNKCTQAQVLTFTWRANGCPSVANIGKTAAGIYPDSAYYKIAFGWAEERGMISASFASKSSSANEAAPRCDIVTYLYKNSKAAR